MLTMFAKYNVAAPLLSPPRLVTEEEEVSASASVVELGPPQSDPTDPTTTPISTPVSAAEDASAAAALLEGPPPPSTSDNNHHPTTKTTTATTTTTTTTTKTRSLSRRRSMSEGDLAEAEEKVQVRAEAEFLRQGAAADLFDPTALPEGWDPDVFRALPADIQAEQMAQFEAADSVHAARHCRWKRCPQRSASPPFAERRQIAHSVSSASMARCVPQQKPAAAWFCSAQGDFK
jgi:hypothetical protein